MQPSAGSTSFQDGYVPLDDGRGSLQQRISTVKPHHLSKARTITASIDLGLMLIEYTTLVLFVGKRAHFVASSVDSTCNRHISDVSLTCL